MSTGNENYAKESPLNADYARAFSLAKQALTYVNAFRTPPTPEVYEVWYRFAEGGNDAIQEQLSHAVNNVKSVSKVQLEQLRQQFLDSSDVAQTNREVSTLLADEMRGLRALIGSQLGANQEFNGSLSSATNELLDAKITPEGIQGCLLSVLQSNEQMQRQLEAMDSQMRASQTQIEGLRESLVESQRALMIDPLTGIGNRRYFDTMMAASTATGDELCYLLLLDLDDFKDINDTYGHATGDDVLRYVATELQKLMPEASVARYGGDEFAMVFKLLNLAEAQQLADRVCRFFSSNQLSLKRTGETLGTITASIGVALLRSGDDSHSWFERADKLLYSAKCDGRNKAYVERDLRGTAIEIAPRAENP